MNPISTIDGKLAVGVRISIGTVYGICCCSSVGIIRIIHTVLTGLQFEGERFHRGTGFLRRCLHGKRYRCNTMFIRCHVCNGFDNRSA